MPLILETVSLGKSARKFAGGCEHCCSACRIANALIKDQVTPMLFRKHIVSTRTLLQLTVAVFFLMAAVGAAVAANTGNTPVLVPYTATTAAGTPQWSFGATPPSLPASVPCLQVPRMADLRCRTSTVRGFWCRVRR